MCYQLTTVPRSACYRDRPGVLDSAAKQPIEPRLVSTTRRCEGYTPIRTLLRFCSQPKLKTTCPCQILTHDSARCCSDIAVRIGFCVVHTAVRLCDNAGKSNLTNFSLAVRYGAVFAWKSFNHNLASEYQRDHRSKSIVCSIHNLNKHCSEDKQYTNSSTAVKLGVVSLQSLSLCTSSARV